MRCRTWMLAVALAGMMSAVGAGVVEVDFKGQRASPDARDLAAWIGRSGDAAGKPFAIVDKKGARLYLFDARHQLVGATEVLLGQTVGDHTVEGVGERAQVGQVGLHERTTPAGRFETMPGRNLKGEHVIWLDYEAAFAIHRLRPGASRAARLNKLRTPTPKDNRASLGCVVVPVSFYVGQIKPLLGHIAGVVYVLPETRPLQALITPQL